MGLRGSHPGSFEAAYTDSAIDQADRAVAELPA
jgi:hypothetical protein